MTDINKNTLYDSSFYTSEETEEEVGICCFCGDYCNPCSQSCGSCARNQTALLFSWRPSLNSFSPNQEKNILFHKKHYSEEKFRKLINVNKCDFDKQLHLNPMTCDLGELVNLVGATIK